MSATLLQLNADELPWHLPPHQEAADAYDELIWQLAGTEEEAVVQLHHTVQQQLTAYTIPVLLTRGPSYWSDNMDEWSKACVTDGMKKAAEDHFWQAHATQATKATKAFAKTLGEQHGNDSIQKPVMYLLQLWIEGGYRDAVTYNPAATNIMDKGDGPEKTAQEWFRELGIWNDESPQASPVIVHLTNMRDGMRGYTQEHTADIARCWVISSAILAAIGHGPGVEDTLHMFDGEAMRHSLADAGIENPDEYLAIIRQELAADTAFQAIMLEVSARALRRGFLENDAFAGCNHMTRNAGRHVRAYRKEQGNNSWHPVWNDETVQLAEGCITALEAAAEALRYNKTPQLGHLLVNQCRELFDLMNEAGYQSTAASWIDQLDAATQRSGLSL